MAHLETKWVHCCQARAFHLILLSLPSDCHPLVNTWCCHQHWYHYSYAWDGDAFTLAAGSPSGRHFHFIINQTTSGGAFSSFLIYATGVEPVWVYTILLLLENNNTEHKHAIYKVVKQTQLLLSSVPCDYVTSSLSSSGNPDSWTRSRISGMETDAASIKRTYCWRSGWVLNPDPGCASDRKLLPHLVCQLGIRFRQHGLQVHKLFQERKGEEDRWQRVYNKS